MSARTILKHVYENGGMTEYQYERIDRVLKERERPQWIPCSERLPDKSGEYYTTYEIKDKKYMGSRFFDAEYSLFSGASLVTVLAWMPLPEPYEKEDEARIISNMKYFVCCPMCDKDKCVRGTEECDAEKWEKVKRNEQTTD